MVEEIRNMMREALEEGWTVEDLSRLLTESLDAVVNDFQKDQEEEEKEKLVDELIEIVDGGLREGYWDWSFVAAAMTLYLLGNYKKRSVQEIKELIKWGEKRFQ